MIKITNYIYRLFIAIDQFINVLLSPVLNLLLGKGSYQFGHPDETLSGVMGKNIRGGHCKGCYYICKILNVIEFWKKDNHCETAIEDKSNAGEV